MNDPDKASPLLSEPLRAELKELLREVLREEQAAFHGKAGSNRDVLLSPNEAAELLGVTPRWLYRHYKQLPFSRKISRKVLRFSEAGLHRWLAATTPALRR